MGDADRPGRPSPDDVAPRSHRLRRMASRAKLCTSLKSHRPTRKHGLREIGATGKICRQPQLFRPCQPVRAIVPVVTARTTGMGHGNRGSVGVGRPRPAPKDKAQEGDRMRCAAQPVRTFGGRPAARQSFGARPASPLAYNPSSFSFGSSAVAQRRYPSSLRWSRPGMIFREIVPSGSRNWSPISR